MNHFNWPLILAILLLCRSVGVRESTTPQFVVWNVGQGLWCTAVTNSTCQHFDWGGEQIPLARFKKVCKHKLNIFYFSHWDWDHIGGLKFLHALSLNACLAMPPGGVTHSSTKMKLMSRLRPCSSGEVYKAQLGESLNRIQVTDLKMAFKNNRSDRSNSSSHVFSLQIYNKTFLVPGDSPQSQEKLWGLSTEVKKTTLLVLGHHGSRTSTSQFLLEQMPNLKMAVASARLNRYGHPHSDVIRRLHQRKIPLLRTEDWGSIHLEF